MKPSWITDTWKKISRSKTDYHKIDEIPFDFQRRRMSVIVEDNQNQHMLICKGAVEEIMRLSPRVEIEGRSAGCAAGT